MLGGVAEERKEAPGLLLNENCCGSGEKDGRDEGRVEGDRRVFERS